MRSPDAERSLRRLVARLASAQAEDVAQVLEALDLAQQDEVRALLEAYGAPAAPAAPQREAAPPVEAPRPAPPPEPEPLPVAGLSAWLAERVAAAEAGEAGRMTPAARAALAPGRPNAPEPRPAWPRRGGAAASRPQPLPPFASRPMGVIKADELRARRVRAPEIPAPRAGPPSPAVDPERVGLERRIEALSAEAASLRDEKLVLETALEVAEADARRQLQESEAAVAAAEAAGRASGFAEGEQAKAEILARLEAAADRALDQFRGDLRGMETLAVALSKAALAKVFGDDRDMSLRVTRLVRRQIEALERDAVLCIDVAASDFPDAAALDELGRAAGLDGIEVQAVEALDGGDCRIRLRLGELDVGLGQQWSRLSALLDETLAAEAS